MRREVLAGRPGVEAIAEIFVELREQRMDHRQAHAIDAAPTPCVGGQRGHGPDADAMAVSCIGEQLLIRDFQHHGMHGVAGEQILCATGSHPARLMAVPS